MIKVVSVLFIFILVGCTSSASSVEDASKKYRSNKEYSSLEIIYRNLSKGMQRKDVENLLGKSDYSPINGLVYYSSNKSIFSTEQNRNVPAGLILDYRVDSGAVTENLQKFHLGVIGE